MKLSAILNESNGDWLDQAVDRASQLIMSNAKAEWQYGRDRHEMNGYHSFEEWFHTDFMGNSYNIEAVLDNLSDTIKRRVIKKLSGSV